MKPWCLKRKKQPLPMAKFRGGPPWNKWPCVTFRWEQALTFDSKEKAFDYLDKYFFKYGEKMNGWMPMKTEAVMKLQVKQPFIQLHTGKVLNTGNYLLSR